MKRKYASEMNNVKDPPIWLRRWLQKYHRQVCWMYTHFDQRLKMIENSLTSHKEEDPCLAKTSFVMYEGNPKELAALNEWIYNDLNKRTRHAEFISKLKHTNHLLDSEDV